MTLNVHVSELIFEMNTNIDNTTKIDMGWNKLKPQKTFTSILASL